MQSVRPIPPLTLDPRLSSTSPGVTPFCLVRGRLRVHRSRTSFGDPVRCPGRIFDFSESWRDPAKALGVSTAGLQVRDDLIADAAAVANEHHVPDTAVRPVRLRCHKPRRYPTVGAHWRTDRRLGWLALHDRAPRPYRRERAWSLGHRRLDQAAADDAQSLIAIEPLRESNRNFVCRVSDVGKVWFTASRPICSGACAREPAQNCPGASFGGSLSVVLERFGEGAWPWPWTVR